jgi:hypothetical protein
VDYDVWDLKGIFEVAVGVAGPRGDVVSEGKRWVLRDEHGAVRGHAGWLEVERPAWAAPLFGFEVDVDPRSRPAVSYAPIPTTPAIERDVALVLPAGLAATEVEAAIRDAAGAFLEDTHIFDEYRGEGVAGRSVAWRLIFRSAERTLRDEEADKAVERVLRMLRERWNVTRR